MSIINFLNIDLIMDILFDIYRHFYCIYSMMTNFTKSRVHNLRKHFKVQQACLGE